jgi:hypothetical protein
MLMGVALTLGLSPVVAHAQSADSQYCAALGASYDKYVQVTGSRGARSMPNVSVDAARSKCQSDPNSAIPVLEGVLKDNKIDLPPRG